MREVEKGGREVERRERRERRKIGKGERVID
jgi:hypothetical protein